MQVVEDRQLAAEVDKHPSIDRQIGLQTAAVDMAVTISLRDVPNQPRDNG